MAIDDRYERGLARFKELHPDGIEHLMKTMNQTNPDLGRYIMEFQFGNIFSRPGLTLKEREMAMIAGLTCLGHATHQVKVHTKVALGIGVTRLEIVEIIMQMALFAGIPAGINAMKAANEAFAETNTPPLPATPPPPTGGIDDRYERGLAKLKEMNPKGIDHLLAAMEDFNPDLGRFILEFQFAGIFSRPGLTLQQREMAMIAGLTCLGNATHQIKVHTQVALNVGVTRVQITEILLQMALFAGIPAAINNLKAANEAFKEAGV